VTAETPTLDSRGKKNSAIFKYLRSKDRKSEHLNQNGRMRKKIITFYDRYFMLAKPNFVKTFPNMKKYFGVHCKTI